MFIGNKLVTAGGEQTAENDFVNYVDNMVYCQVWMQTLHFSHSYGAGVLSGCGALGHPGGALTG